MHHRTSVRWVPAVALVAATFLSACRDDPLEVINPNNPDVEGVFGTPRDVESITSRLFQQMWNGINNSDNTHTQSITMAFESASQLGNFGMGTRAAIPRVPIDNSIGNSEGTGNFRVFDHLSRNARSAANAVAAIDRFLAAGNTMGSPARDARAKSFAYFTLGYALGHLSLVYDSAAVITAATPTDEIPALSGYAEVNAVALASLDSALAIANSAAAAGTGGWPLPAEWMSVPTGGVAVDLAQWRRIIRSHKAKFRAGVARNPAERAAVSWSAVIADATNGLTSDLVVQITATGGWSQGWVQQLRIASTWSQMTPFILGFADTTGAYDTWLQQALNSRTPFLLQTPDKRFPPGATRAAQIDTSGGDSKAGPPAWSKGLLYFRNRPTGEDTPAQAWGTWFYDNHRFWAVGAGGGNGPFVAMSVTEVDMLAAEGHLRTNNVAAAALLIDKTRVRAGLPSVVGLTAQAAVPGGAGCVPRVPQGPSFTTTACGNIFEAMKWEKRLETAFTGYMQWFVDSRGWGDLVVDTRLHWPVPYQELFARAGAGSVPTYTTAEVAAKGTYGFGP